MRFRITASDVFVPAGMVLIPAGSFQMGDNYSEGVPRELPVHSVTVSAFYLDKYEVTKALWDEVYTWAIANGYSFDNTSIAPAPNHPVQSVSWYEAAKWLNARSEKEGRTLVYYTDILHTTPYRIGQIDVSNSAVKWDENGYRLPTEAEWERACRGGLEGNHFPWPSSGGSYSNWIYTSMANYDNNKSGTTPVGYYNGQQAPQGVDMANGYGLYDMAGNVLEWTWDGSATEFYYPTITETDPPGPDTYGYRTMRGGMAAYKADQVRCASRDYYYPSGAVLYLGFRSALSQPAIAAYTITGTITSGGAPLSGVSVELTGGSSSATATTDASGNYVFTGLANGSYTLTPSNNGYTFTPQTVTVNGVNAVQDFIGTSSTAPTNMVLIPAGSFQMGDNFSEGEGNEQPVHTVTVSAFYMDKYEVTKSLWDEVYTWAIANGYTFENAGVGTAANHPVQNVSWYDVVKWLNARSEKEGRTPVYYTDPLQITLYRRGQTDVMDSAVKWNENGYRLPTEAEWEKACRGGLAGNHFPWPSSGGSYSNWIYTSMANYGTNGTKPVGYYNGQQTPQGGDMANGYGLYDMAGNVWELTWDWNGGYTTTAATDPRGPDTAGSERVVRGGGWNGIATFLRCAMRSYSVPSAVSGGKGFRSALSQPQP